MVSDCYEHDTGGGTRADLGPCKGVAQRGRKRKQGYCEDQGHEDVRENSEIPQILQNSVAYGFAMGKRQAYRQTKL